MLRLYVVTASTLFLAGVACTIDANNMMSLASGLLLLGLGAGGPSAGYISRIDGN